MLWEGTVTMKFEVLLATIDQTDDSILDTMGLRSDVIVCNQTNEKTDYRVFTKNGYTVRWYDFQERGVGLNRNNALLRSTADICLLSDDDVLYEEDYVKTVLEANTYHVITAATCGQGLMMFSSYIGIVGSFSGGG